MAEVFDFGLQQHKIKMDGKFFENNLFAVAGDTGRRLEVQLLNSNNMVQNTTGISLRLNAVVAGQATYAEATLVDAIKGLYKLDLPNGMLLAPGNWQFQWQIIGANGEKLHSFVFTGSIGSNLSEGGSEATNFYLNVENLKKMQDDLVNGTFNSEVLETNIAEKLNDLEEQYAPKLTEVTAQLAHSVGVFVEKYGAVGDGVTDDTVAIQSALDNERFILFEPKKKYLVNPTGLFPKSNQLVNLNQSILRMKANSKTHASIFELDGIRNIGIVNGYLQGDLGEHFHEATGKPWHIWDSNQTYSVGELVTSQSSVGYECIQSGVSGDKFPNSGSTIINDGQIIWKRIAEATELGEHGMGISISNTDGIYLDQLDISNCWGDGLFTWTGTKNLNIGVVESRHNRRQGMSICEVDGLYAKTLKLHHIRGTNPSAGLDIEPETGQLLKNIVIDNLITSHNYYSGLHVALQNTPIEEVSIRINNHNDELSGLGFTSFYNSKTAMKGDFYIKNAHYSKNIHEALLMSDWYTSAFPIIFGDLHLYEPYQDDSGEKTAVTFDNWHWTPTVGLSGGLIIKSLSIYDDRDNHVKKILKLRSNVQSEGLQDIQINEINIYRIAYQYDRTMFDFQNIDRLNINTFNNVRTIITKPELNSDFDINIDSGFYSPVFENNVPINYQIDKWRTDKLPIGASVLISPRTTDSTKVLMEQSLYLYPYTKAVGQPELRIQRTGKGGDITITKISANEWVATGSTNAWEVY